jgi:hypothetical protein
MSNVILQTGDTVLLYQGEIKYIVKGMYIKLKQNGNLTPVFVISDVNQEDQKNQEIPEWW